MFHDDQPASPPRALPWGSDAPPPPRREPEDPPPQPPGWRGRDLVIGSLIAVAPYLVLVVLTLLIDADEPADPTAEATTFALIVQITAQLWMGGTVLVIARRRGVTLGSLGLSRPSLRAIWLMFPTWFGAYVLFLLYLGAVALVEQLFDDDLAWLGEGNPLPVADHFTTTIWILLGFSVVIAAPLIEELFFRGFLFRGLDRIWSTTAAFALSGVAFGLIHLSIAVLVPFTAVGILLAWAYRRTGSLWTPIGAHLLVNGVAFTLTVMGVQA